MIVHPRPDPGPFQPALACIELSSIARGYRTCDEMAKRAEIRVLQAITICPGKFNIVVGGAVEEVRHAFARGLEIGGPAVVDQLILPNAHEQLIPAIEATAVVGEVGAVGVVETLAVASAIIAADAACKKAAVRLIELRLARGIGGKAFFTLTGDQADVEAAIEAAEAIILESSGLLLRTEVIPRPHPDMVRWLL
jgi:microcompartment protein CcmL/EutN